MRKRVERKTKVEPIQAHTEKMVSQKLFCFLALFVALTLAHSWIDCTDYTEKNGNYYGANKCRARPRNWQQHTGGGTFGADTGYNHMGGTTCKYALAAGGDVNAFYTSAYPMAQYALVRKKNNVTKKGTRSLFGMAIKEFALNS